MKVFIAIAVQHGFSVEFNACLINLIASPPCRFRMGNCKSPGVGISRNILTSDFLESDCDKLLMLDSDILFTNQHIERISSHDEAVVGGLYAKKEKEGRTCCERLKDVEPVPDERGLIPLRYIGTGFMCVTRDIVKEMWKEYPELRFIGDNNGREMHDWWSVGVDPKQKRYLTEDWWFCHRTIELGHKVWGDSEVRLAHEGRAIYPLELNERPKTTA